MNLESEKIEGINCNFQIQVTAVLDLPTWGCTILVGVADILAQH